MKIRYSGAERIQLLDGRRVKNGDEIEVRDADAQTLVERDPSSWSYAADAKVANVEKKNARA